MNVKPPSYLLKEMQGRISLPSTSPAEQMALRLKLSEMNILDHNLQVVEKLISRLKKQ